MCNTSHMATNISLNEELVSKAMALSGLKTKKDVVNLALEEFVRRHEQRKILNLFGTLEEEEHDYKTQRKRP